MFLHHSVTIHPTPLPPPMIRTLSHLTTPFVSNAGDNNLLTTHLWCGVSSNSWKIQVGRICSGHEKSNSIKPHSIPAPHPTSPHLTSPRLTSPHHTRPLPPPPCLHHGCRTGTMVQNTLPTPAVQSHGDRSTRPPQAVPLWLPRKQLDLTEHTRHLTEIERGLTVMSR